MTASNLMNTKNISPIFQITVIDFQEKGRPKDTVYFEDKYHRVVVADDICCVHNVDAS
jgi:hypothetical protein